MENGSSRRRWPVLPAKDGREISRACRWNGAATNGVCRSRLWDRTATAAWVGRRSRPYTFRASSNRSKGRKRRTPVRASCSLACLLFSVKKTRFFEATGGRIQLPIRPAEPALRRNSARRGRSSVPIRSTSAAWSSFHMVSVSAVAQNRGGCRVYGPDRPWPSAGPVRPSAFPLRPSR